MPARKGAPLRRVAVPPPGNLGPRTAGVRTRARAAVALWAIGGVVAASSITGCEYSYDDAGWRPPGPRDSAAAPASTDPAFPGDSLQDGPVTEAELDDWLKEALPDTERQVIHTGYGLLSAGEVRTGTAADLPVGTYALALACRSQQRVTFTVRNDQFTMVDLGLRCGSTRENVIYLSRESALSFRVEARSDANFAYRLTLL
jgi:hypothetical protein